MVKRDSRPAGKTAVILLQVILLLLASVSWAGAQKLLIIDGDQQYAYAESLYSQGKYQRAIDEFERFIYFFPDDQRLDVARFKVGSAYRRSSRPKEALESIHALTTAPEDTPLSRRAVFLAAECYQDLNAPAKAVALLERLAHKTAHVDTADKARYRIAWIHLENKAWYKADLALDTISPSNRHTYHYQALKVRLAQLPTKQKNPKVAGAMALIPGLGHVYSQRYQDGLVSFLLNTALALAAVESFDNGQPILGGLLGAVGIGFYTGNIYSAVSSSHKYNAEADRRSVESLLRDFYLDFKSDTHNQGWTLSLRRRF